MKFLKIKDLILFFLFTLISGLIWITTPIQTISLSLFDANVIPSSRLIPGNSFREDTAEDQILNFEAVIKTSRFSPKVLVIKVDDCIRELSLNGHPIASDRLPYCDYHSPLSIPIEDLTQNQEFTLTAKVFNSGGRAEFSIIERPLQSAVQIYFLLFVLAAAYYAVRIVFLDRLSALACFIVALGLTWRTLWVLLVSYTLYSYDLDGHIDYLKWIAQDWSIPDSGKGFLFFHPPLYYLISAIIQKFLGFCGFSVDITAVAYISSYLFGIVCQFCWVITILLCFDKTKTFQRLLAVSIVSLLPAGVFGAISITNDSLANMFSSLIFLGLIIWWRKHDFKSWLFLCLFAPLALASKFSTLPIVALIPTIVFFRQLFLRKPFLKMMLAYVFAISIFIVPYTLVRAKEKTKLALIPNTSVLHGDLKISNSLINFVTFSPIALYKIQYFSAWTDASRRAYPLETLFRSAFSGEFDMGEQARSSLKVLHLISAVFILLAILGLFLRGSEFFLPSLMVFLITLVSILVNRYLNPFGSTVNFRYTTYLIAPFAVLIGCGIPPWLNRRKFLISLLMLCILIPWCWFASKFIILINLN